MGTRRRLLTERQHKGGSGGSIRQTLTLTASRQEDGGGHCQQMALYYDSPKVHKLIELMLPTLLRVLAHEEFGGGANEDEVSRLGV